MEPVTPISRLNPRVFKIHFNAPRSLPMNPFRSLRSTSLIAASLFMVGKGNAPVADSGWPAGALNVANLKTRVGWWEGPPFGGGEWSFLYRGDAGDLNQALKTFSAIRAPALQVFIHDGPQNCTFLK